MPTPLTHPIRGAATSLVMMNLAGLAMAAGGQLPSKPDGGIWVSPGFLTWHSAQPADRHLEGRNLGFGLDWQWSTDQRLTLGRFRNSDGRPSRYLAIYHQPLTVGSWRFGVVAGVMDGYPHYHHGRAFPAILPVASWEQGRWGIDTAFIPTINDRLYGGVSVKLRWRLDASRSLSSEH